MIAAIAKTAMAQARQIAETNYFISDNLCDSLAASF